MSEIEIFLRSPDAEHLTADLTGRAGAETPVTVRRLPTRGVDVATIITVAAAGAAFVNILVTWAEAIRKRKTRIHCTIKVGDRQVELDNVDSATLRRLLE